MWRLYFVLVGLLFIIGMSHSITEAQAGDEEQLPVRVHLDKNKLVPVSLFNKIHII